MFIFGTSLLRLFRLSDLWPVYLACWFTLTLSTFEGQRYRSTSGLESGLGLNSAVGKTSYGMYRGQKEQTWIVKEQIYFFDRIRYDKLYLHAPKSWRVASLILRTEPRKLKTEMLRRNSPVIRYVESVLRPEESLWWEKFVKEVGFEPGVKEWGSYGWWKWWVDTARRCGRSCKGNTQTETGMRLTERSRELIPEARWGISKGTIGYT